MKVAFTGNTFCLSPPEIQYGDKMLLWVAEKPIRFFVFAKQVNIKRVHSTALEMQL